MKREEHKALLEQIKNATSDADKMGLLMRLEQDYASVLSERDTLSERANNAEVESAKYAKLNNELWLQNSSQSKVAETTKVTETTGTEGGQEPPKKMTFEDLESKFD